jgi:hypothetical protein
VASLRAASPAVPIENPEAYVEALTGWQRALVEGIRATVRKSTRLEESVEEGHLFYHSNGPALLICAEAERVLFSFWRGQQMRDIEPRLQPGGPNEMATVELREGDRIDPATVRRLVKKAMRLNAALGDPTRT